MRKSVLIAVVLIVAVIGGITFSSLGARRTEQQATEKRELERQREAEATAADNIAKQKVQAEQTRRREEAERAAAEGAEQPKCGRNYAKSSPATEIPGREGQLQRSTEARKSVVASAKMGNCGS